MSLKPDEWFAATGKIPSETPEWTPLCAAIENYVAASEDMETTTEQVIIAGQELCDAWHAYKQRRFGGKVPS